MHLSHFRLSNFRRLKDVLVDLEEDISIFVGANNSGKTSAAHALQTFVSSGTISIHDFSTDCWKKFDELGRASDPVADDQVPSITLDLWFSVEARDLHRVIDLLPSLDWVGGLVGIRVAFCVRNANDLVERFRRCQGQAPAPAEGHAAGSTVGLWPTSLTDYLKRRLDREFELRYFVLDRARFDSSFASKDDYKPRRILSERGRGGAQVLNSIMRVDCLNAQRHLSDGEAGARAEDLSRRMSKFYRRNLEQKADDYVALRALVDSEAHLNSHFAEVFAPTLKQLEQLGYPGLENPRLLIRSALNPESVMGASGGARVHYQIGETADILPEKHNGLGFKNLIYMVVEILDLHTRWLADDDEQVPLHLIFIEEPEAHLHVQLQQVFIRKVLDLLKLADDEAVGCSSQVVVTTHSPHILYERGFRPIRYFARVVTKDGRQTSLVRNVSRFYAGNATERDFLERYMRLAHCDLFFADAVILVEGNVERLLMPLMIEKAAKSLQGKYISILEVGGAFGFRFRGLVEFLGLTTLVVTDIDSVEGTANKAADDNGRPKACAVATPGAETCNQTLIQWLPKMVTISDLLAASLTARTSTEQGAVVRVAYQGQHDVVWRGHTEQRVGRTFEEAFALQNLEWCQDEQRQALGLRIPKASSMTLGELAAALFSEVKSAGFKKTDFALAVLEQNPEGWAVPRYIDEALKWLQSQMDAQALNPQDSPAGVQQ